MNNTIWQIIGVLVGLIAIALVLSYVSSNIESQQCHACNFEGYQCIGDMSASCLDTNYDTCKEYSAEICILSCNQYTGKCEE